MNIEDSPFQFMDNTPKIRVIIRKRPLGKKEIQKNDQDIIEAKGPQTLAVRELKVKVDLTKYWEEHLFNFDRVFDEAATNQQIYLETIRPLVESAFQSAKVTCFAYGQTGSGKTFTMMGESGGDSKENYYAIPGLYLLAAQDVFALLEQPCFQHLQVFISFYEIYCTKLHDLLNDRQQLFAREDGKQKVNIVGLSEKRVLNVHSLMQIIDFGNSVRTTSSTSANDDSSRSHAILQITLKNGNKVHGKMSFIDLAGSERGADVTDTNKQTRMDGAEINKSLLALKECIRALDLDKKHTPFRGSKLTLVLKDSFTGNCKTVMIGNISPAGSACEHTLNTLRYADRVKELKKPNAESSAPLSSADLLAQQLMLPRQNKNTVKLAMPTEDNPNPMPMPNPYAHPQSMSAQNNNAGNANKGSKARFSMPVYPGGNQGQGLFPQNNMYQNQMMYNNNGMYQNNTGDLWNQDGQQLYNQHQYGQDAGLRDILNIQGQKDTQSLLHKNNMKMMPNNNYQPNMYQNNVPFSTDQPKQPYNFSAQINLGKKKGGDDYMGSENSTASKGIPGFKPAPSVNMRNNNMNMEVDMNRTGIEENKKGEELLSQINKKHEDLINVILAEEEEVISMHRQHIDDMVDLIKQEMGLLNEVDKPASDIDEYVESLDAVLSHKLETITVLKGKLMRFREHLKEEEVLSKKFHEQKNEMMDIFDLAGGESDKEDMQLLDNLHQVV